jgi:hypothetical protein
MIIHTFLQTKIKLPGSFDLNKRGKSTFTMIIMTIIILDKDTENNNIRHSIVVSIPACHAGDQGSIPCDGKINFLRSNSVFFRCFLYFQIGILDNAINNVDSIYNGDRDDGGVQLSPFPAIVEHGLGANVQNSTRFVN